MTNYTSFGVEVDDKSPILVSGQTPGWHSYDIAPAEIEVVGFDLRLANMGYLDGNHRLRSSPRILSFDHGLVVAAVRVIL